MQVGNGGNACADDKREAVLVLVHLVEDVVDGGPVDVVFVGGVAEEFLAGAELGVC